MISIVVLSGDLLRTGFDPDFEAIGARRGVLPRQVLRGRGPGLTFIFAPFQQMMRVSLRTVTMQIPSQKITAKDNVSIDIAAEGEYQAAVKLGEAADIITRHPVALLLRTLQTMAEIPVEKNSTIIFPVQFMTTVKEALATLTQDSSPK